MSAVNEFLAPVAEVVGHVANGLSVVAIACGLVQAFGLLILHAIKRSPGAHTIRTARVALGRWLVLALELALAADIVATIVAPTWNEIGKLAAIVVLRTVLNYFLGREIEQATATAAAASNPR